MKRVGFFITSVLLALIASGCASSKTIMISSVPKGSFITIGPNKVGLTPQEVEITYDRKQPNIEIEVSKDGWVSKRKTLVYPDVKKNDAVLFELDEEVKDIKIQSDPSGALVYIDGEKIGRTSNERPITAHLSFIDKSTGELRKIKVWVEKNGYEQKYPEHPFMLSYDKANEKLVFKLEKVTEVETVIHEIKEEVIQGSRRFILKAKKVIAELDVIERSPNVKSVTQVTNFEGGVEIGSLVLSPDGKKLISQARAKKAGEKGYVPYAYLWSMNVGGGTGITTLTYAKGGFGDIEPTFSSDGKYIYFSSDREGENLMIWRIQSSGAGGLTKVTSSKSSDREAHASPDGAKLAYSSLPPNAKVKQIWTINTNGSLPTQLREGYSPKWSPDGLSIVFISPDKTTGRQKIWTMRHDGSNPTQLTFGKDYDDIMPSWSPDGKKIVFASDRGLDIKARLNYDIWMMNADGSELTQLTTNGSLDDYPAWDPTGDYIYFRSNRGGNLEVWRIDLGQ